MAYIRRRKQKDGTTRFYARYLGADGKYHEEGGYRSRREAERAGVKREQDAVRGEWWAPANGRMSFKDYIESHYWPTTVHLELTTRQGYRSTLDHHHLPRFGAMQMRRITAPVIQAWVNEAAQTALSPRSIVKQHALLHRVFNRAIVDRVVALNPCAHTDLPKVVLLPKRIIAVEQFDAILEGIPARYRTMVLLEIETGLRWGELIALRPVDIDFSSHTIVVRRTIIEISRKNSPTGERCLVKDHPKDDKQRDVQIEHATCNLLREHMVEYGVRADDLLFTSQAGTPISRNNFRKFWLNAVAGAEVGHKVTFHNLRAAHASWLLAGGADIVVVQQRLGHRQIMTTQQYIGTLPDAGERAIAAFRRIRYGESRNPIGQPGQQ